MYARVMGNGMIQTAPFSKITGRSLLEMKIIITKEIMAKKVENFRTCGYWYALENVFFMILGGYYYSSLPILINYLLLQGLDKDQEQSVLSEVFNSVLHRHFTKSPSALLTSSRQAPLSEYSPSRTGCSEQTRWGVVLFSHPWVFYAFFPTMCVYLYHHNIYFEVKLFSQ